MSNIARKEGNGSVVKMGHEYSMDHMSYVSWVNGSSLDHDPSNFFRLRMQLSTAKCMKFQVHVRSQICNAIFASILW